MKNQNNGMSIIDYAPAQARTLINPFTLRIKGTDCLWSTFENNRILSNIFESKAFRVD